MVKANQEIRKAAKEAGIYLWQIADRLGYQDSNFSKMLRYELPKEKQEQVMAAIVDIKSEEIRKFKEGDH